MLPGYKKVKWVCLLAFCAFLSAMCGGVLVKMPWHDVVEGTANWHHKFEQDFENAIPFKGWFVRWNNYIKLKYFHVSPAPLAFVGKDGWIYLDRGRDAVDIRESHRAVTPLSEKELQDWFAAFAGFNRFAKDYRTRMVYLVAPEKSTIYPEYLDGEFRQIGRQTRYDQVAEYVGKLPALDSFVFWDIRPELFEAKKNNAEEIYFKTGAHWNDLGIYAVYQTFCKRWQVKFCLQPSGVIIKHRTNVDTFYGNFDLREQILQLDLLFEFPRLPHLEKRSMPWGEVYKNPDALNNYTVILSGDSFGQGLIPYFINDFQKTIFINSSNFKIDLMESIIQQEGSPYIIVREMAERYFMTPVPGIYN